MSSGLIWISDGIFARRRRHPERRRSSGGAKDLPLRRCVPREIPQPAGKNAGIFGMTPCEIQISN